MQIRPEKPEDAGTIARLIEDAFRPQLYSNGREQFIMGALRAAGVLTISLVAEEDGEIIGQVAFSPVTIDGEFRDWYGLGPVAVRPDRQRQGVGKALIQEGLRQLRERGAAGCVLLGNPAYYNRFGFEARPELVLEGVPPEYFLGLPFESEIPSGTVQFHSAFEA
jgi:putative acetyltransferase